MVKLRTVIVDDSEIDIDHLNLLLREHKATIEVSATFTNPLGAIEFVQKENITLVFVDIRMHPMNGFEFVQQLNRPGIFVVFVTNYEEYALKAFELSALDYLTKPVSAERLQITLNKIRGGQTQNIRVQIDVLQQAMNALMATSSKLSRVIINNQQSIELVNLDEITYCKADGPYTIYYLHNGKQVVATKPLKYYDALLTGQDFFRLHRSYIVNLKKIKVIDKLNYSVKLDSGETIPVNPDRLKFFLEKFRALIEG